GFGLIVGALLARFVSKAMQEKGVQVQPALLGAAGYLGMAVWHGGLSGSAPLKVAEEGHFLEGTIGVVSVDQTIFTSFNLILTVGLLVIFLLTLYGLSGKNDPTAVALETEDLVPISAGKSGFAGLIVGVVMIFA